VDLGEEMCRDVVVRHKWPTAIERRFVLFELSLAMRRLGWGWPAVLAATPWETNTAQWKRQGKNYLAIASSQGISVVGVGRPQWKVCDSVPAAALALEEFRIFTIKELMAAVSDALCEDTAPAEPALSSEGIPCTHSAWRNLNDGEPR
jgi:hypothetical protein